MPSSTPTRTRTSMSTLMPTDPTDKPRSALAQIPSSIWVLGFVSLLMDISSEMIHSLLPLFMVTTLGASAFTVGLVEGAAEATALIVKVFSGVLSDYIGKRKGLALFGYALGALSKPLFALAPGMGSVLTARLLTASARAYVVRRATRWWPTSHRPTCAAPPSVCASHWTPWAPSSARSWRWR